MTTETDIASFTWQPSITGPLGSQLLLLTIGNIPVLGQLNRSGHFVAWAKLPPKSSFRKPDVDRAPSGTLLVINPGGSIIVSAWRDDCKFLGWHKMPSKIRPAAASTKNNIWVV